MLWDDEYAPTTAGLLSTGSSTMPTRGAGVGPRKPGESLMCYAGGAPARRLSPVSDGEIRDIFKRDLYEMYPQHRGIGQAVIRRWPIGGQYRAPGITSFDALRCYAAQGGSVAHYPGDYFVGLGPRDGAVTIGMAAAGVVRR
jgi:hypothetical protein